MGDVSAAVPLLVRRAELLRLVSGSGVRKPELVERLDVSRSTVDRSVRELESVGLVLRDGSRCRLTVRGRLALDAYDRFVDRLAGIDRAGEVLDALPADCALDPAMLEGAEVVVAERAAPDRPLERYVALLERASRVRLVGTAVSPRYMEVYDRRVREEGLAVAAALPTRVVEQLATRYADEFAAMLATGRVELRELGEPPPYSLAVFDLRETTRVGLLVTVPDGVRGLLTNERREAVRWGVDTFERYWRAGEPVPTPPGDD